MRTGSKWGGSRVLPSSVLSSCQSDLVLSRANGRNKNIKKIFRLSKNFGTPISIILNGQDRESFFYIHCLTRN